MAKRCGINRPCGMSQGLYNPFFQNGSPWFGTGGTTPNYGQLSDLLDQPGNGSTTLLGRTFFVGNITGVNWNAGVSYNSGELRVYPLNSPIMWRVKRGETVGTSENPPVSNPKWERVVGFEALQYNSVLGKYIKTTLQRDNGEWVKMGPSEVVNPPTVTKFAYNPSLANYISTEASTTIGTSTAVSISIPTSHPSSRSITIASGLSNVANSTTLGTCSDSFAIPTTVGTMLTRNFPTGLSIAKGDTVVLYGDANNFVICAVARYYSSTGLAYLTSIQHLGTGTFSSWTVKKEQYRRISRTSNAAQHFHALIQTYDSGTGVLVVNSVKNTGSVTVSDWTVSLAKEMAAPTSSQTTQFNALDAEATGYFFVVTCNGTGFEYNCTVDNRGVSFRAIYVDGPLIDNPPPDEVFDTYNATLVSNSSRVVFNDIGKGTHTFFFVSITSVSGLSANTRTWGKASTNPANTQTLGQYYNYHTTARDFEVCGLGNAVGEFAINFRANAEPSDSLAYRPYHQDFTLTATHTFKIDGNTITHGADFTTNGNPYDLKYVPFTTFELDQIGNVIHPEFVGDLGSYTSTHLFDRYGWSASIRTTYSVTMFNSIGYVMMCFLNKAFGRRIKFSNTGTSYISPQGVEADVAINALDYNSESILVDSNGVGSAGEPNYALSYYMAGTTLPWTNSYIDNYNGTYVKLYNTVYANTVVPAGTVEDIALRWYIGNKGTL